jgi:hypothetical protein
VGQPIVSGTAPEDKSFKPVRNRLRRIAWGLFRFIRTALLVFILSVAVAGLFLNKVGLPDSVKQRVIAQARARGFEVQFSRLRLSWHRGFRAENVHITGTNDPFGPHLFVEEAECPVDPSALWNLDLRPTALRLRGGRLVWPLAVRNDTRRVFLVNDIRGQLRFEGGDRWELEFLQGTFHGIRLELTGSLANPLLVRHWKRGAAEPGAPSSTVTSLHRLETLLRQLKLEGDPKLVIRFKGDGKDLGGLTGALDFTAPQIESAWGAATNLSMLFQIGRAHV